MTEQLPVPADPQPASVSQAPSEQERPGPRRQPISVAFLPLALVAFVVLSFVAATWTLLATAGT
jgi:hypothetical protein